MRKGYSLLVKALRPFDCGWSGRVVLSFLRLLLLLQTSHNSAMLIQNFFLYYFMFLLFLLFLFLKMSNVSVRILFSFSSF